MSDNETVDLITRSEAADLLGVSTKVVRNMLSAGSLVEIDGTKKIAKADVLKFKAAKSMEDGSVPQDLADHVLKSMKVS